MMQRQIAAVVVVTILSAIPAGAGEIDPELQAALSDAAPDSLIPIALLMTSQLEPNVLALDGLGRGERRGVVIDELKSHAENSQEAILDAMMSAGGGQIVQDIRSTWLANAVYARANASAIWALSSRSDVRRAMLNRGAQVPDETSPSQESRSLANTDGRIIHAFEEYFASLPSDSLVSVIIFLREQIPIATLDAELRAERATLAMRHERVITALKGRAIATQGPLLADLAERQSTGEVQGYTPYWIANLVVAHMTVKAAGEVAARSDVESVEPNFTVSLIEPVESERQQEAADGSAGTGSTFGLEAINAPRVWDELGITGAGRLVCGLDTGVMGNHEALQSRWRGAQPGVPWHHAWKDLLGTNTQFPTDTHGHGTHTMGTMVGSTGGGVRIGVAWGAEWIACNAINQAGPSPEFENDVIAAFQWIADPDGNPQTNIDVPDVVENSWGLSGSACHSVWWAVIDACEAAGCAVVFIAGNSGPGAGTMWAPADRITTPLNAFSVGAVDASVQCSEPEYPDCPWQIWNFSSRGPSGCDATTKKPEVVAPGVEVLSCNVNGSYIERTGTSVAGPHVAGIFALLREANPNLDVATMKQMIIDSARDLGSAGEDNTYGWGIPDAYKAVFNALNPGCYASPNPPCDPPCWHCDVPTSLPQCGTAPATTSWAITWIHADDVWDLGYKGDGVVLGQVDNGFEYVHSDLGPNHFVNFRDPVNGIDDDQNGYKDDYSGWDFTSELNVPGYPPYQDPDPYEQRQIAPYCSPSNQYGGTGGHGTGTLSVAVGAGIGNGASQQLTGVAPHAWFVPIKSGDPSYFRTSTCCQGTTFTGGVGSTTDAMQYALVRESSIGSNTRRGDE